MIRRMVTVPTTQHLHCTETIKQVTGKRKTKKGYYQVKMGRIVPDWGVPLDCLLLTTHGEDYP